MTTMRSQIEQASGIPLGGLGTGSIEIRPDGYFHEWQIFNVGAWAPGQPECCRDYKGPDMPPGSLAFFVRTRADGREPLMRRLGLRTDQHNLYSFTWLKSVRAIEFEGRYPLAALRYEDDDLPVTVSARLFSPFIPHDARISGTPGFHAIFTVRNRTDRAVETSLLSTLRNPVAWGEKDRRLFNRVSRRGDTAFLTLRTKCRGTCNPTLGSLGLAVSGGEPSWISGEFSALFGGYSHRGFPAGSTPYGMSYESIFHEFRNSGRLPSLPGDRSPVGLLPLEKAAVARMSEARMRAALRELMAYPFVRCVWDRVRKVDPGALRGRKGLAAFLADIHDRLRAMTGENRERQTWGDAALASTIRLAPGEERDISFALGWHFPLHFSQNGPVLGHAYEHWFEDAEAVTRCLSARRETHRRQVEDFAATLYDTTLEPEFADAWSGQLSTLAKCTWWTKAGDFAVWEGLGCCGFHTTDITYQGSFNILALFPELQKRQMLMGARFQRADGRVHHFFTPDLSQVDDGFDRVDMNQQFVLLACRDYLWTADRAYLRRLWPHVVRAMANTAALDTDGDGLPDRDTRRNTYDGWNFFGTPSYIASLWLGALLAAVRMAEDLGARKQAAAWKAILRKGTANFERKLWNGEYYSLWVDGKVRDECCMSDQIDGEWFTGLVGLGHALPEERIASALRAIVRYNYSREAGLVNASYPPGRKPRLSTYRNFQQTAPWTGIEYAIASMLFDCGMAAEGRRVVRNIHERYLRAGRFWNHVECGDHYCRAMSSWAVLLGVTGFKADVPRERVSFAPAVAQSRFRAPWVSSSGWGSFTLTADAFDLECRGGKIAFRELELPAFACNGVALNGKRLKATLVRQAGRLSVRFPRQVAVRSGDCLRLAQG